MSSLLRSAGAVMAGLIMAGAIGVAIEALGHMAFPLPEGVDPHDPASLKAVMDKIPLGALLFVLLAWGAGAFVGAGLAARLAGRAGLAHGMIVGVLLLLMGVATMLMIPHPLWMWMVAIPLFPASAYVGSRLAEASCFRLKRSL